MASEVKQHLLFKNLKLLTASYKCSEQFRGLLCKDMFNVPNQSAFEHVVCFLINSLHNEDNYTKLKRPIPDKKYEADFRYAVYSFIKELRLKFPEAKLPTFAQSALKSPGGPLIVNILLTLSTLVMVTSLKRDYAVDNLIVYSRMNNDSNVIAKQSSLTFLHERQFDQEACEFTRVREIIDVAFSEMTSYKCYIDSLINEKHQYMLTLLEDKLVCSEMKERLLDLGDNTIISHLNSVVEEKWVGIKKRVSLLVEYEQLTEQMYNTIMATENTFKSPVFLDGSMLCLPLLSEDLDPELKMLILSCKKDDKVVLQTFLEMSKYCLKLRVHELNDVTIPDVSGILPCLSALAMKYQEIEASMQNACMLLNVQHDQLTLKDEPIRRSEDIKLPFEATPPIALLTGEFINENCNTLFNVCDTPVGLHNRQVFDKRDTVSVSVQSVANLLLPPHNSDINKCMNDSTTASLKKQGSVKEKDVASVRKRVSQVRRGLQPSVTRRRVKLTESPFVSNVQTAPMKPSSCLTTDETNTSKCHNFEEYSTEVDKGSSTCNFVCNPSTKESSTCNPKETPTHSQFVISSARKRNRSHDRITIPLKLASSCLPDDKMLDKVVNQMLQNLPNIEEAAGNVHQNTSSSEDGASESDFSGVKELTSSSLFYSPVDYSTPRHNLYHSLQDALSPDSEVHPIFRGDFSDESSAGGSPLLDLGCLRTDIDQLDNLDVLKNVTSDLDSENRCTTSSEPVITPSPLDHTPPVPRRVGVRKSLELIIEKFKRIKQNMNKP